MNDFNGKAGVYEDIPEPLKGLKEFEDLNEALQSLRVIQISGCIDAAKATYIHSINNGSGNRIIVTFRSKGEGIVGGIPLLTSAAYYPARIFYSTNRISGEMF